MQEEFKEVFSDVGVEEWDDNEYDIDDEFTKNFWRLTEISLHKFFLYIEKLKALYLRCYK